MHRLLLTAFFLASINTVYSQAKQVSLGIFTGITTPYTWDEGINRDSRYQGRYEAKLAPIGIAFGVDHQGYGFVVTPSLITIGQNFHMINTVGGQEGLRKINMKYVQVPIALKLHVIDMVFFKVSLVAGVGGGYLLKGSESIAHNNAKYRFPTAVYPVLPENYVVEYDGVLAPKVEKRTIVEDKNFNKFQVFASLGFRSDWNVSEAWRVSFDVRANYSFLETRNDSYLARVKANQQIYDMWGKRREIFAYLNVGIARYIEIDKDKQGKAKKLKPGKTPHRGRHRNRSPR